MKWKFKKNSETNNYINQLKQKCTSLLETNLDNALKQKTNKTLEKDSDDEYEEENIYLSIREK